VQIYKQPILLGGNLKNQGMQVHPLTHNSATMGGKTGPACRASPFNPPF